MLIVFNFISQVRLDSSKTVEQNYQRYFHPAYIYGSIIPSNLEEAIVILMHDSARNLQKSELCLFKGDCQFDLIRKWGLDKESLITIYFNKVGVYGSETMERIIVELFFTYLTSGKYNEKLTIESNYLKYKKKEKLAKKNYKNKTKLLLKGRVKRVKKQKKKLKSNKRKENMHPFFID
jgi:hypothetical protein